MIALAPTISALKKKLPGSAVGIVASESLREASLLLPELDFFAAETEDTHADHTIDLVGAELLENAAENLDWKAYLSGPANLADGNPYHLMDLLKKASKTDTTDVNFELAIPEFSEEIPEALVRPGGLKIAVCTASLEASVVDSVLESLASLNREVEIFLIGTVKDKRVSSAAASKWDGKLSVHDLCGKNSLAMNAIVLRTCDISVTGPGLSSLISSGYGTFTVCLDNSKSRGALLYPYGHGHLIIQRSQECELETSLSAFLQDLINYAVSANTGSVPTLEQWQEFADTKIFNYLGKVRLLATQRIEIVFKDSGSFTELHLRPLLFTGSEIHDVMHTFYRLLWEHSLNGRTITTYDLQILHLDTTKQLCELLKPLEQLYELGNFGRTYSVYVKESLVSGKLEKAAHEGRRLQEVEDLVHSLAGTNAWLAPICTYHTQRQPLMRAESPIELAEEMSEQFSALQSRVMVLLDLAKSLFHTVFENESALGGATSTQAREAETNG
jgi:hypothetical protein